MKKIKRYKWMLLFVLTSVFMLTGCFAKREGSESGNNEMIQIPLSEYQRLLQAERELDKANKNQITPEVTVTPVPEATKAPTDMKVTSTPQVSPVVAVTATPTVAISVTKTPTPTLKATATVTPTVKPTAVATPTTKPTAAATPTSKPKASATPTLTSKPKASVTPTPTTKPVASNGIKICIDPGHQKVVDRGLELIGPGTDETVPKMTWGAVSTTTNMNEYEWNLIMAKAVKEELELRGYEVILTRETNDEQISYAERAQFANKSGAVVLIGIEADDYYPNPKAEGVYAIVPGEGNVFVSEFVNTESVVLANSLVSGISKNTGMKLRENITSYNMAEINWSEIPVCLLQIGYMSNPQEDKKLQDKDFREKIAVGLANGLEQYLKSLNKNKLMQ